MNKPTSELIALADTIEATYLPANNGVRDFILTTGEREMIVQALRAATNNVDALLDRVVKFDECTTAEPTLRWMIRDYYDARLPMNPGLTADYATRFITVLATPPAQPAPAATHGKSDGAVRDEKWVTHNKDGSVSLDAYAGWPRDALKMRCYELTSSLSDWQWYAVDAATSGGNKIENVPEGARIEIQRLIDAYSDSDDESAHSPKIAAAETSPGDAYREVIDEGLIARHLGVAKGNAKAELNQILDWDVAAALDPAVSGRKA